MRADPIPTAAIRAIPSRIEIVSDPPPAPRCPGLRDKLESCIGTHHYVLGGVIPCPMQRYDSERKRLAARLALCGYPVSTDGRAQPVAAALWRALSPDRPVQGLTELLAAAKGLQARGWVSDAKGHAGFYGAMGTAKTHVEFVLYFAALYAGLSSIFLTSSEIREVAQDSRNFDEAVAARAKGRLLAWQKYKLIVIDDLGDQKSDVRAREPGETAMAATLLDLLNATTARIIWSSNLGETAMREHCDLGPRIVDRLFADHHTVPCVLVKLDGNSQRQHALRGGA